MWLNDYYPSICGQLKAAQQQTVPAVMSSACDSSLCLFRTCMLMICHIQEMCDWLTRACGWSGVVLMSADERESSSGYSRKIHSWQEWKQRNAAAIDCWHEIYAHTRPCQQSKSYKIIVWSTVFSPHGRELIFRSDEMWTMFCSSLWKYSQTCFTLWSGLEKSLVFIEP